jgi:hypothetical protein
VGHHPPPAPPALRPGGGPAFAARHAPRGRARLDLVVHARARGLAVLSRFARERRPVRARRGLRPARAGHQPVVPALGDPRLRHTGRHRRAGERHLDGRAARLPVGRHRAHVPGAPHHVERQLGVPHLGRPDLPLRRPQPQQPRHGHPGDGRGLAQQPPRVPRERAPWP